MPIQPIPEQQVAVVQEGEKIRVVDLAHDEKIIMSIQTDDSDYASEVAWKLAREIIAKPAIVHVQRVAFGLEKPRRLLPGGQLGD